MSINRERPVAGDRLSLDAIHDLLRAPFRRYTLYCLYFYSNPVRLPDVAEQVVEWEHGMPGEELLDERLYAYNDLYHSHVPKLADANVVAYSQSEDMVELAHNAAQLRPYLEQAAETDLDANDVSML